MTSKSTTKSPPFKLTERDLQILADIAMCGGLTAEQIGVQHFNPTVIRVYKEPKKTRVSQEVERLEVVINANCQKRLKLFLDNGYTRRVELYQRLREGKKPFMYSLTRSGAQAVASYKGCTIEETGWREREVRLRPNYAQHHISINDIRLAVMRAVQRREDIALVRWYDEVELAKIQSKFTIPAKLGNAVDVGKLFPDACFVLRGLDGNERYHFIEYDAGTEVVAGRRDLYRTFATKMSRYVHFLFDKTETVVGEDRKPNKASLFEKHYGVSMARVLTVTTSAARRQHLLEVSESDEVGAQRVFWLSTHPQVITPSIKNYRKKSKRGGVEFEEDAYQAILPDILSGHMWLVAKDKDATRPEHALDEPFKRLMQQ